MPLAPLRSVVKRGLLTVCTFDGCDRPYEARGFCRSHATQLRRGRGLSPLYTPRVSCDFPGCEKPHVARGYCGGHARQLRDGEDLRPLRKITKHSGEWHTNINGYVQRWSPGRDGRIEFEHRRVMEGHIGRSLLGSETVHHVNGVRNDNRVENLELWSSAQPYGQRVDDKVAWAIDTLRTYRPDALA